MKNRHSINIFIRIMLTWAACMMYPLQTFADDTHDATAIDMEDDDSELRTGPVDMEDSGDDASGAVSISRYPFLNLRENVIKFNGDDWSDLRGRFAAADDTVVSIVHIGDSHLQADGATARTRTLLQNRYGSSGRGLIVPFRLARTNQPVDYSISSDSRMVTATMMRMPYATEMGFTGVSLEPRGRQFDITVATRPSYGPSQEFDCIKVYGGGDMPRLVKAQSGTKPIDFDQHAVGDTLSVNLHDYAECIRLVFETEGKCNIFGLKLENSMTGVEYHVIGNNGARYDTYNRIGGMGNALKALSPNLIIISLGANEAYGRISDHALYSNIDTLVKDIRSANPGAHILLVTPGPCQKKYKGVYRDNADIKRLRNVMLQYGADSGVATYDWYGVAGGEAGSGAMLSAGLLSKDRIHNTLDGYRLQGELFYNALIEAIGGNDGRD